MQEVHASLINRVKAARTDVGAADRLIEEYVPFIKSETAKFLKGSVSEDSDEYSIAMLAFYEAIRSYSVMRGAFLRFAALQIRSRLIDYYRKERRHKGMISLEDAADDAPALKETITDMTDFAEEHGLREATRSEIHEFSEQLFSFGVDLNEVCEHCPKQERTLAACRKVLVFAREREDIMKEFLKTGKLPMAKMVESGVERKTIERHRKYIVALLLAYTNGFDIIRGHIACVLKGEK